MLVESYISYQEQRLSDCHFGITFLKRVFSQMIFDISVEPECAVELTLN